MESTIPEFREVLDLKLREIIETASSSEDLDREETKALLGRFGDWVDSAAHLLPRDMPAFALVVRQLNTGLDHNRPPTAVLHRLLRTLGEVNRRLERMDAHPTLNETDPIPPEQSQAGEGRGDEGPGCRISTAKALPLVGSLPSEAPTGEPDRPCEGGGPRFRSINDEEALGFEDFLQEVPDQLGRLEEILLAWDRGEKPDSLEAYRLFHTLKGICGFLGLSEFSELAHGCESTLSAFKDGGSPEIALAATLLRVVDLFRNQSEKIRSGLPSRKVETVDVKTVLDSIRSWRGVGPKPTVSPLNIVSSIHGKAGAKSADEREPVLSPVQNPEPIQVTTPAASDGNSSPASSESGEGGVVSDHLRVPVERIESLLDDLGELSILHAELSEWAAAADDMPPALERMSKALKRFQERLLSLRLVPLRPLFLRMERVMRELSRRLDKPLKVHLEGADTELDKHLVEELVEPLLHLVRNSVDHGLEQKLERLRSGKETEGHVHLKAKTKGGTVSIEIEDDGRGLDPAAIAAKARELGWWEGRGEANFEQVSDWIFRPGFSTAKTVTQVSGRGVGLDVVARKIRSLHGTVRVKSVPGRGTLFILQVPLTLVLMDALLLRVGLHRVALPTSQVRRFHSGGDLTDRHVGGCLQWVRVRGEEMPLMDVAGKIGAPPPIPSQSVAVEVEVGGRSACFLADEVLGRRSLVVKSLKGTPTALGALSGGAFLPDGTVGLALDPNLLT